MRGRTNPPGEPQDPARRLGLSKIRTRRSTPSPGGRTAGCTAATASSRIQPRRASPGTPDAKRTPINAGMWRYHPTRHESSKCSPRAPATRGGWTTTTTASSSSTACVIPHCFHIDPGRPGTHRQAGSISTRTPTPTSRPSPTTATTRARTRTAGNGRPATRRRRRARPLRGLMMLPRGLLAQGVPRQAVHGQPPRPPDERRHRSIGQGLRLRRPHRSPDFLLANDKPGRKFINLQVRPRRQRLSHRLVRQASLPRTATPEIWDRTNGRIYKISYRNGAQAGRRVDLSKS